MKIRLISHACVLIDTGGARILSDPWFFSKAFNESWSLFPEPAIDTSLLDSVHYLWISHEHPDHFHMPTLKSFPQAFKERVTVLFQLNNSDKVPDALRKIGFKRIERLPHRRRVLLPDGSSVYSYQSGVMDS